MNRFPVRTRTENFTGSTANMDLFSEEALFKLSREEEKVGNFVKSLQKLRVISTRDHSTVLEDLLDVKFLFQKMLPKMPREYILRQVFDCNHCSLVLLDSEDAIIGAACYRPAFERGFVEIVFFAVGAEHHISGYGTFLFSCLKEVCKKQYSEYLTDGTDYQYSNLEIANLSCFDTDRSLDTVYSDSSNLYLLTYADNSAIGFFKKQGFTLSPVSSSWMGYIKDYDGGTLMECKLHRRINMLAKKQLIENVRNKIFDKMREVNDYHIVRSWEDRDEIRSRYGIFLKAVAETEREAVCADATVYQPTARADALSAGGFAVATLTEPAVPSHTNEERAHDESCPRSSSTQSADTIQQCGRTSQQFLYDFIFFLICNLESNSSAWPFLEPVSAKDVPDYFDVIKRPIDLSTISTRHKLSRYTTLKAFTDDVYLMVNNCFAYNGIETQYYKCGEHLRDALEQMLTKYRSVILFWGFAT